MPEINRHPYRAPAGFTLIELLMVMVVIAVIMVIVLPKFGNPRQKAQEASLRADLRMIRNAINSFQADTGQYPNTLLDLTRDKTTAKYGASGALVSTLPGVSATFGGPYLDPSMGIPADPTTGTAFNYILGSGTITSANTGTALDGTAYNSW